MLYTVEVSGVEQVVIQQAANMGEPIPERIAAKKRLRTQDEFFYQAFLDLDTERSHSYGGLTKIPRSVILSYAEECGLGVDGRYELVYVVRALDDAHLEELAKKTRRPNDEP